MDFQRQTFNHIMSIYNKQKRIDGEPFRILSIDSKVRDITLVFKVARKF